MSVETRHNKAEEEAPFFIGYMNNLPKGLGSFLMLAIIGFVAGMSAAAFALSSNQQDPGNGDPGWGFGRQELIGRLEFHGFPILRVPADGEQPARSYLMAGMGKRGAVERSQEFEGVMVRAEGFVSNRDDTTMMQIVNSKRGLDSAEEYDPPSYFPQSAVKRGKWQLTGEICDGKCYAGLMRPGRGLAHKACANLCLLDGVPPVFVTESPVLGKTSLLLVDKNGRAFGKELSSITALYLTAEGQVEQVDDMLIFKMDIDSVAIR